MRKKHELLIGCMSAAGDSEMTFVLLARDKAAPAAIRAWVEVRVATGKNKREDKQIQEALSCARTMEYEQEESHNAGHKKDND